MHRNRHYMDLERDKRPRPGSEQLKFGGKNHSRESDEDDFETYAYEYKKESYLRTPSKPNDAHNKRTSTKHHVTDRLEKRPSRHRSPEATTSQHHRPRKPTYKEYKDYSPDEKNERRPRQETSQRYGYGQRGKESSYAEDYAGRKHSDHSRGKQNPYSHQQWQEDYSRSDDYSVVALGPTGDPNVGLTKKLESIDSSQKNYVLKEIKTRLSYSDDISTANHLQTESSPTVLILGGINPERSDDYFTGASMFVHNVKKNRWLFGGTMPEPRNYHGAVYLNGKVYVTGGYSPFEVSNGQMLATQSLFELTVRSKRWKRKTDMQQARACHATCVMDDNCMVLGGRDDTGKLLSTVEVYYPKRDQWSFSKPMPEPMMGMACAVLDGSVYVIGGMVSERGRSSKFSISNRVYAFDIQKQSWHQKLSLPESRAFACAASLRREIWLWCGMKDSAGEDAYRQSTNTVFAFNPELPSWEKLDPITTAKHGAAITKFGRRIYLLGGMSNIPAGKEVLDENDCYNKVTERYSEGAPLPRPLTGTAAVTMPIDYVATSDPKWNYDNIPEGTLNDAATRIQAVYRGYKTRSVMSSNILSAQSYSSDDFVPLSDKTSDWKRFQRVKIDDFPPSPDPKTLPSELNVKFGTLPKGYTVSVSSASGKTKVRRYIPLPENVDPNLGMCGHICNYFKKTKKILGLRTVENLPSFCKNMLTVSTLQDDSFPVVLIMGGLEPRDPVNLSNGKLIMRYNPLKNRFEYFGVLPAPRNYHAAVYHQNHIYVIGGCDPDKRNCGEMVSTNTTYCLDIHSREWEQKANLNCSRSHHSAVVFQGRLYAIGGRDHNGRLVASIEVYDFEGDKWTLKHPMSHPRMGMACTIYGDQIWCMGGIGISDEQDEITYPILNSVLSYDVENDSWTTRPPLRCTIAFATCVTIDDSMWLFGGCSRNSTSEHLVSKASVDKYYPDDAQWLRRTLLNNCRHGAAIVPVESCVYVFGGTSSQEWGALTKNEMLITNDASLHSCLPLPVPLTGLAAVVVPPVEPSLRAESVALLLHANLTFH